MPTCTMHTPTESLPGLLDEALQEQLIDTYQFDGDRVILVLDGTPLTLTPTLAAVWTRAVLDARSPLLLVSSSGA